MGRARLYGPLALLIVLGLSAPSKAAAGQQRQAPGRTGSAAGVLAPSEAPAGWSIVLHDGVNFRGRKVRLTAGETNISPSRPPIRSVTIGGGVWQLCSGPHFTGHCMTLARSASHVGSHSLGFQVRSLRPLAPGRSEP